MKKNRVGLGLYVVLILIVVFIWYSISNPQTATYTSSQFDKALAKGEVASAVIHQNEQVPTGSVTITTTAGGKFTVYVSDVGELQDTLDETHIDEEHLVGDAALQMNVVGVQHQGPLDTGGE